MTAIGSPERPREELNWGRVVRYLFALPLYFAAFMFLPAGTWEWQRGWLFLLVFLGSLVIVTAYLRRVNPDVVAARTGSPAGTRRWDKILLWFLLPTIYAIIPVAALDEGRFHWFPVPWWVCATGYVIFLIGMGIVTWAEAVNRFFEVTVRIQTERGHKVIDTGPYAIVRHPGYVAGILICAGAALCLGSLWALIPAGLASALLVLRTRWEDQTLQAELPGYKEYAQRVRSRLVPGVW
jgi:protein-S-isoprenylcysteine O-methyltransferase Ste14